MKFYNNYYYAQVNVRCGHKDGYSFMVKSEDNLDDDEILERAKKAGLFQDDGDIDDAEIVGEDELFEMDIDDMKPNTTEV